MPNNPAGRLISGRPIIDRVALERAGMIDWHQSGSRAAEEFRIALTEILRHNASADRPTAGPGPIMITSALPGEGKTFTAINLAVGIARQGEHRVLLVDGDGRQGGLGDLLGIPVVTNVATAAAGGQFDAAVLGTRTCIENLDFLKSAPAPRVPTRRPSGCSRRSRRSRGVVRIAWC